MSFWKSKPEDAEGEPLTPMKGLQILWRSVFEIDHAGHRYAIDTDLFDFDEKIHFYIDGYRVETQDSPAKFELPGGVIEVNVGTYGLTRAHFVRSSGEERLMSPAPGTSERWRLDLRRQRPTLSTRIDWAARIVLVVSLILQGLQVAEWGLPNFGIDFTSPISLPTWVNIGLIIAGFLAAIDRALQMKNNWLLDSDWL